MGCRIVEARDRHRRRVERNLHDGAQQRLVGTALTLRLASRKAEGNPAMTELLNDAAGDLDEALAELRDAGKALMLAVGGNRQITPQQRDWIIGYLAAAGDSEEVIEALRTYDDADLIEDIMSLPKMAFTRRGVLYDALRVSYVAGTPDPAQLDRVLRAADAIGISRDEVAELQQVVAEERALQRRRYELVTVPVLPLT